jgi:putative transcriptional regulator
MTTNTSLANQLLIAMPSIEDPNISKSVIYVCEHQSQGTVGLMINRPMQYPLGLVFDQLQIEPLRTECNRLPLLFGGPLHPERGFVIHRPLGGWRSSLALREGVTVTTSNDIIRAIAQDTGPKDALVALGYVGWGEGQLDIEMLENVWLVCPFKPDLLYEVPFDQRWDRALLSIGVKSDQLISGVGHA